MSHRPSRGPSVTCGARVAPGRLWSCYVLAWAAKAGTGRTLDWPVGEDAEGKGSVTSDVFRTPMTARPTPPPAATCPCQPRSGNSPVPRADPPGTG